MNWWLARRTARLRDISARYIDPDVLIIDEVGYLHHASTAANVLYGIVDGRHRRHRPMLFTTNKPTAQWGDVLHDHQLAEAILDRVLERGTVIEIRGEIVTARSTRNRRLGVA